MEDSIYNRTNFTFGVDTDVIQGDTPTSEEGKGRPSILGSPSDADSVTFENPLAAKKRASVSSPTSKTNDDGSPSPTSELRRPSAAILGSASTTVTKVAPDVPERRASNILGEKVDEAKKSAKAARKKSTTGRISEDDWL